MELCRDAFANFQFIKKFENTDLNVLVETDAIPYDTACSILGENTRHIVELNLECLFIEAQMNKCYPKLADAGFIVSNRAVRLEGYLTSSTDIKHTPLTDKERICRTFNALTGGSYDIPDWLCEEMFAENGSFSATCRGDLSSCYSIIAGTQQQKEQLAHMYEILNSIGLWGVKELTHDIINTCRSFFTDEDWIHRRADELVMEVALAAGFDSGTQCVVEHNLPLHDVAA